MIYIEAEEMYKEEMRQNYDYEDESDDDLINQNNNQDFFINEEDLN